MKRFFPVIHVKDSQQALRNVLTAKQANADGVFLISHNQWEHTRLNELAREAKEILPWIGVNYLYPAEDSIVCCPYYVSGLWVDNAEIDERLNEQSSADKIEETRQEEISHRSSAARAATLEYFGGVAFKHQRPVTDYSTAASIASKYMDVVTTSGVATGIAASIDKIEEMRQATTVRLGIASGVTPENVDQYLPYIDDFLVATGISMDFYNLDPHKTAELSRKIHVYR